MKVVEANREIFYSILGAAFKLLQLEPTAVEVGVLKGDNSAKILEMLSPKKFYLIDQWNVDAFSDYRNNNDHRNWVSKTEEYAFYFGGDLTDQTTFDVLYNNVLERFKDNENVSIIRESSLPAVNKLKELGVQNINLAYIDASHQFETVLDDLLAYHSLIDRDFGCIQLNDCCYSDIGNKQNLGVLEAAVRFCKMTDFEPIALVNRHWTDVLFTPRHSKLNQLIENIFNSSDIPFVEIPNSLFGSLIVKQGIKRGNISFCS